MVKYKSKEKGASVREARDEEAVGYKHEFARWYCVVQGLHPSSYNYL
jgi:hypothetical protein